MKAIKIGKGIFWCLIAVTASLILFQNCSGTRLNTYSTAVEPNSLVINSSGELVCSNSAECDSESTNNGQSSFPASSAGRSVASSGSTNPPAVPASGTNRVSNPATSSGYKVAGAGSLSITQLVNANINSPVLYGIGVSALAYSEQVVLSGLPQEGALISISELQSPELGTSHFGFNINGDSKYYGFPTTNKLVYNGDRIKFKALPSQYFNKKLRMSYKIGSVYEGEWSVTTMADPGTKPKIDAENFGFAQDYVGKTVYSKVITVKGLGNNNLNLLVLWNFGEGFELGVNGVWYQNPTQMSAYGTHIKNGDQLQFRYVIPSKGTKIASLSINLPGVDRVSNPQATVKVVKQWDVYPR